MSPVLHTAFARNLHKDKGVTPPQGVWMQFRRGDWWCDALNTLNSAAALFSRLIFTTYVGRRSFRWPIHLELRRKRCHSSQVAFILIA